MKTLYIIIGCDTDPDRAGFLDNVPVDGLTWRGMAQGIPRLKESVSDLTDGDGRHPVFTWLLRVDEQVRRVHGHYAWALTTHRALLEQLESDGDELGWHPHFWRFDEPLSKWYQETEDLDWQVQMLKDAHRDYMGVFPSRARSVRMGWDYHNNQTFQTLENLGVHVDFSAIPGLKTLRAGHRGKGENFFDWYVTPRVPYFPSRADYRRPSAGGEASSSLLEAPNFTSASFLWGLISGLQFARKMKDPHQLSQAIRRPTFWINITGRPNLFAPLASQLRRTLRQSDAPSTVFVSYFHPDELLPNASGLYAMEHVKTNLQTILHIAESNGVRAVFSRAEHIPSYLSSSLHD